MWSVYGHGEGQGHLGVATTNSSLRVSVIPWLDKLLLAFHQGVFTDSNNPNKLTKKNKTWA